MAFCAKCGVPLSQNTTFCASCSPPNALPDLPELRSGIFSSHVAGALTYLLGFITVIIFLVKDPYNRDPFVRFHYFQSILFSVFWILLLVALKAFTLTLTFRFLWLYQLIWVLIYALRWAFVLLSFFLMYKAFRGERFALPIIGELAARRA